MKRKVILTCAITGSTPIHPKYPYTFPVTPAQICDAVMEAANAGATIAHIHVREPETGHFSNDVNLYKEVVSRIRDSDVDIVINLTGGMGAILLPDPEDESKALPDSDILGVEERVEHLVECLPEIASLDVTTGNQAKGDWEVVYLNTTRTLRGMAKRYIELGVKPELEIFEAGDLVFTKQMIDEGLVEGPPMIQFVLGTKWCAPADAETMIYLRNMLPEGSIWSGFGISRLQMPMLAQAALLGGNVRVGLEDNIYLERGVFATNGQLVERGRRIIEDIGHTVATPADAREMLNLKNY